MYVFNNDEVGTVVEHLVSSTVIKVVIRYDCRKYAYLLTKISDNSNSQSVQKCSTTQNNSFKEGYELH